MNCSLAINDTVKHLRKLLCLQPKQGTKYREIPSKIAVDLHCLIPTKRGIYIHTVYNLIPSKWLTYIYVYMYIIIYIYIHIIIPALLNHDLKVISESSTKVVGNLRPPRLALCGAVSRRA